MEEVNTLVELCFSRKNIPGLEGSFWRFEGISVVDDPALRKEVARRIMESSKSVGAIARIIIEEITRFTGCERACMKFPVNVEHIPELTEWFPDCKIVHITRDPRALAMSKSNDPFGTAIKLLQHPRLAWLIRKMSIWFVIAQYRRSARVHRQLQQLSNYKLFRYEDLLAEPEKTLRKLCKFIDVDFTRQLLHPERGIHLHQASSLTGKQKKAFDPSAAVRWQKVMPAFDKWLITNLTKRSMRTLGYDPATHPIFHVHSQSLSDVCTHTA